MGRLIGPEFHSIAETISFADHENSAYVVCSHLNALDNSGDSLLGQD